MMENTPQHRPFFNKPYNLDKLKQQLDSGKMSKADCARHWNVGRSTITQACKKFHILLQ